ncbi:MAG: hypothetical protein H6506_00895 [Calditrichaeota bacterium]|nr:hypothetical protein [Calditrichota bacterium]MCB9366549.1 hypothetical protein [Calditrichota bacterium]MCB9391193.1 hypothetical protein [Calditrichota bacterium]
MSNQDAGKLSIFEIFAFLGRWRRVWIISTLVCAVALGIYSFVTRSQYRSIAVLRSVEQESGGFGSILASKLAGLGNLGGFSASLGEVRGDYYLLILRGRAMSEAVIDRFDLRSRWRMPTAPIEEVIEKLNSTTYFKFDAGTNTIKVQVDDWEASKAKEICDFYVSELDQRNQSLETQKARKEREFVEKRLAEARETLYALEDSMAEFQRTSGIFNLEEQARATVQAVAAVQVQRTLAQAEYQIKSQIYEKENPELQMARLKKESADSSLARLINNDSAEKDFLLRLDRASEDGKTYLRLYRDIEINSLLSALMTQQYEQARYSEARNTPTMLIVEPSAEGTKRVWPKRGVLVGLGAIIGFALSGFGCLFYEYFARLNDPAAPGHEDLKKMRRSWQS